MSDTANVPALPSRGSAITLAGSEYEVAKQVTRNVLRQQDDEGFFVLFEGPIRRSEVTATAAGKQTMDPPEVADVMNLETGELCVLIINTVLGSELRRAYPDDAYVGKAFGIKREQSPLDKRYKVYKIIELRKKDGTLTKAAPTLDTTGENGREAIDRAKGKK